MVIDGNVIHTLFKPVLNVVQIYPSISDSESEAVEMIVIVLPSYYVIKSSILLTWQNSARFKLLEVL